MTAYEKRKKVVDAYSEIIGRNIYSQDVTKRECVFTPYKDGKYYSDCSASIRKSYQKADIGLNNIGGNTVAQYQSPLGKKINIDIKKGIPTDISKLRIGDCFYFAGTDASREYVDFCGHVEMVRSIDKDKGVVTLQGHGSGNPSVKDMNDYCTMRYNKKAPTKKGNTGLIAIVRFIPNDNYNCKTNKACAFYNAPNQEEGKICSLKEEAKLLWKEDCGKGWSKVMYGDTTGYVKNSCIGKDGLSSFRKATITKSVALRSKMIVAKNTKIGAIKAGKKVTVIYECDKWLYVRYKGKYGYIYASKTSY